VQVYCGVGSSAFGGIVEPIFLTHRTHFGVYQVKNWPKHGPSMKNRPVSHVKYRYIAIKILVPPWPLKSIAPGGTSLPLNARFDQTRGTGEIATRIVLQKYITITYYKIRMQTMNAATLSFRAPPEFAEQTKALARALSMSASDYVREAVREKNERAIKDRMVFLSRQLSAQHLAENLSMDGSVGDDLGQN
jgi:predicted DNA-binding protein